MSFINDTDDNYLQTSDIIAKTLYLGMFTNVLIPMGLLMVCYYISQNYRVATQVGEMGNSLFFVFEFLAIAQAVFAFWKKTTTIRKRMNLSEENFQNDLTKEVLLLFRPIFMTIASISLYGYLYFFLTGRFRESAFLVLFSFLVFQFVRPRQGAIEKIIKHQKMLLR